MIAPQVRPNEWNKGNAIMNLSSGEKSATERTWETLERSEACECTTPFGFPSEPDVNRTMAGSKDPCGASADRGSAYFHITQSRSVQVNRLFQTRKEHTSISR